MDHLLSKEDEANGITDTEGFRLHRTIPRVCVPSGEAKDLNLLSVNAIYHLHGTLRTLNSAVMTTRGYAEAYYNLPTENNQTSPVFEFLRTLFTDYTIIFVGSGLNEFVILERLLSPQVAGKRNSHFALLPTFAHQMGEFSLQHNYLENFGITPIPYYVDENHHDRLLLVLNKWVEIISSHKDTNFLKNLETLRTRI